MAMTISSAFQSIIACAQDWQGVLINPRYMRDDYKISWAERASGNNRGIVRQGHVLELAETGQYSFQFADDGSIMQLYYEFGRDSGSLVGARLAYFNAGGGESLDKEESGLVEPLGTYGWDEGDGVYDVPGGLEGPAVGWIRLEFDPLAATKGIVHPPCHLHIGGFPDARLIVNGVPTPRQFVEFVISSFYPEVYRQKRLSEQTVSNASTRNWVFREPQRMTELNADGFAVESEPMYQLLCHFRVPGKI